ncbi:MAG: hypothetical protein ACLFOY_17225 [Desulfatibacillaceae bacterium]
MIARTFLGLMCDGFGEWTVQPMEEILGKAPEQATVDDLRSLGWRDSLRLFHAAPAPAMESMDGEYRADLVPAGVFAPLAGFYTYNLFGPGRWGGKAFRPMGTASGEGYNMFAGRGKNAGSVLRRRRFATSLKPSMFDGRTSFCLDYSPHNRFLVHSMRDELREVNAELFLGLGAMAAGGGAVNPAPFVVYGKPEAWVGAK